MQKITYKLITLASLGAILVASFPASAGVVRRGRPAVLSVTQGRTYYNVDREAQQRAIQKIPGKIIVNEEQINSFLAQYGLSMEEIQAAATQFLNTLKSIAEGGITEEDLTTIIAAVQNFIGTHELQDNIDKLIGAIKAAVESNSMENDQATREVAKAMLIAAARTMQTQANTFITVLPTSSVSPEDQNLLIAKLNEIITVYKDSETRVSAIDTADANSAKLIKYEFATMYYNPLKTAYFQTTGRPIFGATETLIVLPTLNYILTGMTMLSTNIGRKVDAVENAIGYADPARAYLASVLYLIGNTNTQGKAQEHLLNADKFAHAVINSGTADRPLLSTTFGSYDMLTAAQMMQSALHMNLDINLGRGR
jgi:hypothetical protein